MEEHSNLSKEEVYHAVICSLSLVLCHALKNDYVKNFLNNLEFLITEVPILKDMIKENKLEHMEDKVFELLNLVTKDPQLFYNIVRDHSNTNIKNKEEAYENLLISWNYLMGKKLEKEGKLNKSTPKKLKV